MRSLRRTMTNQHIGVRPVTRSDAFEKVVDVVQREVVRLGLHHSWRGIPSKRVKFIVSPVDQQPAFGSTELNAIAADSGD